MANRTRVAQYVAEQLNQGGDRRRVVQAAAAWLVAGRRTRDARYLARDVAAALAQQGYLFVRVTTAKPMTPASREAVKRFLQEQTGAKTLELEEAVEPALLGGVQLDLPAARLDASVRRQLTAFIEGAVQ